MTSCRFTFHATLQRHDTAFVTWTMHPAHPRLDGGRGVEVEGCSHLRFAQDGRVARHRDYFDAGALLFFVRFFRHHGLLSVNDRPQWYTLVGGSRSYIPTLNARSSLRCPTGTTR